MKILEFGDKAKRKIILIHGFQCPSEMWRDYIEHYREDFHIIVPVMSGHEREKKTEFVTFQKEAEILEDYIISNYGEDVYAFFAVSMGGVLGATLWQRERLHFEKVIFDGSPLAGLNGFMRSYMTSFYLDVTHKSQIRDEKTLKQATKGIMPKYLLEDFLDVLDNMSDSTIENSLRGVADFRLSKEISHENTNVYFFHGTKANEMLAKKSAKHISKHYPKAVVKCFKGKAHCENTLFNPEVMIKELDEILY